MKRALKIIIPLILIIGLLGGAGWYFGFYNRPMTVDLLLSISTGLEGSHFNSMSATVYDWAYSLSDHDPEIAIKLAESYKKRGNYTKAEYTLVNAIAQNPSVELYIALSKTYIAQDKLLDASTMLDNITDVAMKAELEALRPAVPTSSPEQGLYSNYLDVTLQYEGGTLYYSTDGTYPSLEGSVYKDPITLSAGETNINALVVGENGLVSSRSIFGYTVDGVIEDVTLSDLALDAYIRELLAKNDSAPIRSNELWGITEITVPEDVKDFSDFTYFVGLTSLTIQNQSELSLQFLTSMGNLESLDLSGSRISRDDLPVIASLPKLKKLTLARCGLSNIDALSGAASLSELDLSENSIQNLSALSSLPALQTLDLHGNVISDLSGLTGLNELKTLNLSFNSIASLDSIGTCPKLEELNLSDNALTSLSGISKLSSLKTLNASNNQLADISQISACALLAEVDLSDNSLADVSALAALPDLSILDISYNEITALPSFSSEAVLLNLLASHNNLEDVSGLSDQQYLTTVDLDYNENLEDISALDSCPSLGQVNVYGTKVTDVSDLRERDVVVNFNPTI